MPKIYAFYSQLFSTDLTANKHLEYSRKRCDEVLMRRCPVSKTCLKPRCSRGRRIDHRQSEGTDQRSRRQRARRTGARRARRTYRAQPGAAQSAAALSDDSLHRIHQRHRTLRHGRRGIITAGAARRHRYAPYYNALFSVADVNEALDYIEKRGDNDPLWPMYAAE